MNRRTVLGVLGLTAALAGAGFGHDVGAQARLAIGGRRSNFGQRRVRPGFMPDPINVNITSGGTIDASTLGLGAGCVGWLTQQPDYIVRLTGTSANLRMYVTSTADVTLLVNSADAHWHCNDDSYGGTNPSVDLPNSPRGQYDIWVGSYRSGVTAPSVLHITELSSNHP